MKPNIDDLKLDGLRPDPSRLDRHRQFPQFVHHVCPGADPNSILLFGQVMRANNLLEQAADRHLEDTGLTYAKFRLLMSLQRGEWLGRPEGLQPSELSDAQGVSRNTVSALISSLEADGLISRELHGTDRRRFVIRLTPEGRRLVKQKMSDQFKFVSTCFQVLSPEERRSFLEQLTRLNAALSERGKTGER